MIPSGFTAIRLTIPLFEPVADEQIPLLEQESHDSQLDLDHLIERLMLRLGDEAVAQARLLESHVPEHAYETGARADGSGSSKTQQVLAYPLPLAPYPYARPLLLLNHPTEIRVMVCPSHDCDGRPISFTFDGQTHHVAHALGPERIAGQWWLGHNRTRDYFAIETETARRWWVFRVRQTSKWYLHGQFE
jgi:protein ImuB